MVSRGIKLLNLCPCCFNLICVPGSVYLNLPIAEVRNGQSEEFSSNLSLHDQVNYQLLELGGFHQFCLKKRWKKLENESNRFLSTQGTDLKVKSPPPPIIIFKRKLKWPSCKDCNARLTLNFLYGHRVEISLYVHLLKTTWIL